MAIWISIKKIATVAALAQLLAASQYAGMAKAEMITTEAAISGHSVSTTRDALLSEVRRGDVREELVRQGVNPDEAEARLAALTDAEIQTTISQLENDSAGAGIVGTLATVFLILVLTDILCLTDLFDFTRCSR